MATGSIIGSAGHEQENNVSGSRRAAPLRCLVVGAASGIGQAVADRFNRNGHTVIRADLPGVHWPRTDSDDCRISGRFLTNVATPTERGVAYVRSSTRRKRKMGPEGLVEKRPLYVQLMKDGHSNSAACRILGISVNTGQRWLHGRGEVQGLVQQGLDPRPRKDVPVTISSRYLSEDERTGIRSAGPQPYLWR